MKSETSASHFFRRSRDTGLKPSQFHVIHLNCLLLFTDASWFRELSELDSLNHQYSHRSQKYHWDQDGPGILYGLRRLIKCWEGGIRIVRLGNRIVGGELFRFVTGGSSNRVIRELYIGWRRVVLRRGVSAEVSLVWSLLRWGGCLARKLLRNYGTSSFA